MAVEDVDDTDMTEEEFDTRIKRAQLPAQAQIFWQQPFPTTVPSLAGVTSSGLSYTSSVATPSTSYNLSNLVNQQ
jgi:hypothetical protein